MERRSKIKTPDAILSADWHLRDSTPACRDESFESEQWRKIQHIKELQEKYNCPVLHAADLFHHWKPSPYLLSKAMQYLPNNFWTNYGNHDLPQHNLDLAEKCGIYALEAAGKLNVLPGVHWGYEPDGDISFVIKGRKILVWHVMTYQGQVPYPGCTDTPAGGLLRKYKDYDLILTGHNHKQFVVEHKGRILLNPGCITRQESSLVNFEPTIWFYYADTNKVKPYVLPYQKDAVSKPENVERMEERNERIDAFVSQLEGDYDSGINFEQNLEAALSKNKVDKEVVSIIYECIES